MSTSPRRIVKLDEKVINRIAAGEIIQRPSNALKELLENSLDANSTQIRLLLRDGGITELRIEDNGDGILVDDFNLLCERFATSKLRKYEDLYSINTYGFRGEALASISHCSQLTITSKTKNKNEPCAYRAHFIDGQMYDPDNPDIDSNLIKPQTVAGMPGTQIIVKKLFYNMPLRQKALKTRSKQEYNSCLKVVSSYAIHNYKCSFIVSKIGSNHIDLNYKTSKNKTSLNVIKLIYGNDIANYLINIQKESDKIRGLKINGIISNCDFAMNVVKKTKTKNKKKKRIFNTSNKMEFILFINHRLVESSLIKKCIISVYQEYLAKNHFPFVYLSIEIPSALIDVNVHPTKKEVKFLHNDIVLQLIQDCINEKLEIQNNSRTFHAHSLQHFMNSNQSDNNNNKTISIRKKHVNDIKIKEDIKNNNNKNQLLVHNKGDVISLDDTDSDDDDNNNNKVRSPHAPLKRKPKKLLINDIKEDNENDDNNINDNNQIVAQIMDIDINKNGDNNNDDDDDDQDNDIILDDNNNNNNNNSPLFRRKRKRSYSQLVDSNDDSDDTDEDKHAPISLNINNINPSSQKPKLNIKPLIVSLDLNEKKKKTKSKKQARVRVDSQQSSLHYFWRNKEKNGDNNHNNRNKRRKISNNNNNNNNNPASDDDMLNKGSRMTRREISYLPKKQIQKKIIKQPECVKKLVLMLNKNHDKNLKKVFQENVYVGCIDSIDNTLKDDNNNNNNNNNSNNNTYQRVLFQYDTQLFLCNIYRISRVYFFELCLTNIGKYRSIYKLTPNPSIKYENNNKYSLPTIYNLILLALDLAESGYESSMGTKSEVAKMAVDTLCCSQVSDILLKYFSIQIDIKKQTILSIPCLIDGYIPPLLMLPIFLLRLVTEITWFKNDDDDDDNDDDDEIEIEDIQLFKSIAMEIARFYQIRPPNFYLKLNNNNNGSNYKNNNKFGGYLNKSNQNNNKNDLGWILQHVIFRSMNKNCTKYSFHPPSFLCNDGSIVQIACTKQLYKVFERC